MIDHVKVPYSFKPYHSHPVLNDYCEITSVSMETSAFTMETGPGLIWINGTDLVHLSAGVPKWLLLQDKRTH